jgi:hypothetical protein
MQSFILVIICCVTMNDFVVKTFGLPPVLRFLPEAMSAIVALYVLFVGTRDRFRLVAPKYWLAFGALTVVLLCGIIDNQSATGPMLSGMRFYLRAVPLFLLPAVLPVTVEQLERQFKLLLAIGLLQVPLTIYQRWVLFAGEHGSGDDVKGTIGDSGMLSVILICMVLVLTGLLLRRRIGALRYSVLAFLLLIPTMINETKVTVIFLPVGLLLTLFIAGEPGKRLRYMGIALGGLALFGALFVPVYNTLQGNVRFRNEHDIVAFFSSEKKLEHYLSSDVKGVGTKKDVRRGDAILVPLQFLAKDPVRLAFGLGMGAVSPSNFGKNFEGSYYELFRPFLILSYSIYLLEFGVLGLSLIGVLFWLVFRDSLAVARQDESLIGGLASGWAAVVVIVAITTFYNLFHEFASATYLYAYYAGALCARRVWLASRDAGRGARSVSVSAPKRKLTDNSADIPYASAARR